MQDSWKGGMLVRDLIDDVRVQISDDAHLYTDTFIISAINSALKIIALEEDARRIFRYKLQTELATLNADGTPAARWDLQIPGKYIGKEYFNLVKQDECYVCLKPCYKQPKEFFNCCAFPENERPGDPCSYTLEHFGDTTTLILDRPPADILAVDATIYIIPRRIRANDLTLPIGDAYSELLAELVKIVINKEQTSFDQARMRYEDYDKMITDVVQQIALTEMNDELTLVVGGLS